MIYDQILDLIVDQNFSIKIWKTKNTSGPFIQPSAIFSSASGEKWKIEGYRKSGAEIGDWIRFLEFELRSFLAGPTPRFGGWKETTAARRGFALHPLFFFIARAEKRKKKRKKRIQVKTGEVVV